MNRFVQAVGTIALTVCLTIAVRQVSGEEPVKNDAPLFAPVNETSKPKPDQLPSDKPQTDVQDDSNAKLEKLLRTPVTIKFDGVSLANAILQVVDTYHLPITEKSRELIPNFDVHRDGDPVPSITAEYQRKPLRVVLNELVRARRLIKLYWIHSNGMIEIGTLNENEILYFLNAPLVRIYDVSSIINPEEVPATTDKPHPLVKAVLDAALANGISVTVGDTKSDGASVYEPAATLMRSKGKALLIVRHNTLAHHEIANFLDDLKYVAESK